MSVLAGWLRIALRDLRGDVRRFGLLLACLALGVATIAAVGSVGTALQAALDRDARTVLGGDIEAQLSWRRADAAERALFDELGQASEVIEVSGRASAEGGTAFLSIRGVDGAWPLLGAVETRPAQPLQELLAQRAFSGEAGTGSPSGNAAEQRLGENAFGLVAGSLLADRLGLAIGDTLTVGGASFVLTGLLDRVPDQVSQGIQIGIPALMSVEALEATGILAPGVLARYRYKILLETENPVVASALVQSRFPEARWQIRTPREAIGDLARFFDIFSRFLVIVGLASLLVGGVGVSNAVTAYLAERRRSIATLRAIGATGAQVMVHFLAQVIILAGLGIGLGLVLGGLLSIVALPIVGDLLSIPLDAGLYPGPLLTAAAFGALIGLGFAWLPLQAAQRMKPAMLFRSASGGDMPSIAWRDLLRPAVAIPMIIAAALTYLLAATTLGRPLLVLWFGVGAALSFALLRAAAALLQMGLRRVPPLPGARLRNALKSIHRPGAPAPTVVLSLGLGLALLLMIALVDSSIRNRLAGEITADAPSFVLMDLFPDEADAVAQFAATEPSIESFQSSPMLRGAVTAVDGRPVAELRPLPDEVSWIFEGETPMTWARAQPQGTELVAGDWWPEDWSGEPLVSVGRMLATPLNLEVGDTLSVSLFGEEITARIANIRDMTAAAGPMNINIMLSPGQVENYPQSYLGLVKAVPGQEDIVQGLLVDRFPEIIFLAIGDALETVTNIVSSLSDAVAVVGGLAVISGILVLAGAMAAGRRQREADAVIMKVLGARRGDIILAFLAEYGLLGLLAATLGTGIGVGAAWAFLTYVLESPFNLDIGLIALVLAVAMIISIGVGMATTWSALSARPVRHLRTA
ncbi:putative ABC transport system permease protein [Devosia enhydra]|uniref:Putative ABC transport system permease protein n=1 Tax=Devosia enhydra TaxID=665118 RepID=A0A1K2I3H5_9HYPH|nr:FtsX-like permease family protein [Devosia enhydra]SFZ86783.1 putative ABC transport system permease protein [Devosia enhydra]